MFEGVWGFTEMGDFFGCLEDFVYVVLGQRGDVVGGFGVGGDEVFGFHVFYLFQGV